MENRFKRAARTAADEIINAGKVGTTDVQANVDVKEEQDSNKAKDIVAEEKNEVKKIESDNTTKKSEIIEVQAEDDYYSYKKITPQHSKISKTSDKYKVNYSFEEETLQKFLHMYISEYASRGRVDNKYYSIIAAKAVELLYEVNYVLGKNGTHILQEDITVKEILRRLSKCEIE